MSKKQRDLTADEKTLWRRVAASVKPRRALRTEIEGGGAASTDKAGTQRTKPMSRSQPIAPPKQTPAPQDRRNEKRVRRGRLDVGGSLDLHGHTQDSARAALRRFLRAAQQRGDRTVIVITGVGRAGEGVLKRRLPEWLAEPNFAALVSGYAPAHRSHGGAGAFYVFLRRAD